MANRKRSGRAASPPVPHPGLNVQLCSDCGAVLPAEDGTRRLLHMLSQLSRFGLGGESPPLLESQPSPQAED